MPPAAAAPPRFWRYLLRPVHVVLILSVMCTVQFFEHWGWLDGLSSALLDSFYILTQRDTASTVAVVDITDEDYRQLFQETSPLDPRLLYDLVDTIARFRPLAIGVDLDTSAAVFQSLRPPTGWPPVVWAVGAQQRRGAAGSPDEPPVAGVLNPLHSEEPDLIMDSVLGRPWSEPLRVGLSIFLLDPDNTVRRYSRSYRVSTADGHTRTVETLPSALSRAAGRPQGPLESSRPVLIRFPHPTSASARLPASFVLHALSQHVATPHRPWPKLLDLFKDRVVLIGGTYQAARDSFSTPYGPMSGVDLVAAAVGTEFAGGGMDEVQRVFMLMLDAALAVLLIYFGYSLSLRLMLTCDVVAIAAVTALSFFAFSSGLFWLNTTPLLVAVMLHQWGHRVAERRHGHPQAEVQCLASVPESLPATSSAAGAPIPDAPADPSGHEPPPPEGTITS